MNIALVLSGGRGMRMDTKVPKQYIEVRGKPVFAYCIETLCAHKEIDAIQIVADSRWHGLIWKWLSKMDEVGKFHGFSNPGKNRQISIWNGLQDIGFYANISDRVLIHDAARPLLSKKMITDCFNAISGHDGVLPALPMKDTVYQSIDGKVITALLNREELYAGQAPEVFCLGKYYEANRRLFPEKILKIHGSSEPALLAGMDITVIPGDEMNFKITTREDMEKFLGIVNRIK